MRLCRFRHQNAVQVGFYSEEGVVPLAAAAAAYADATHDKLSLPAGDNLLDFLPPDGKGFAAAQKLAALGSPASQASLPQAARCRPPTCELLVPIPRPNKIFLLAGNYADHIKEGGGIAAERAETFPYVFMKPPTTTLTDPGQAGPHSQRFRPSAIDWELELAVVIGRRGKGISGSGSPAVRRRLHGDQRHLRPQVPPQPGPQEAREGHLLRLAARQVARHVLPAAAPASLRPTPSPTRRSWP